MYPTFGFLICCVLLLPVEFTAQEASRRHLTRLEGGISVGGSGSVYFFAYDSGVHFQMAHGLCLDERSNILAAAAYENYRDGNLLPLTLQADRTFGKNAHQLLKIHAGYAFGFNHGADTNYDYRGGAAAGAEYGWYLWKGKKMRLFMLFAYRFRRNAIVYRPFENAQSIRNRRDSHLLGINAGIEF